MFSIHAEYRTGDYATNPINDWFDVQGFETMRPCPKCRKRMRSNGKGIFWCLECEYADRKDVTKLLAAGLDYPIPAIRENHKWRVF